MKVPPPQPLPNTHLARVDCNGCGRYVLAVPEACDMARCPACWIIYIESGAWRKHHTPRDSVS